VNRGCEFASLRAKIEPEKTKPQRVSSTVHKVDNTKVLTACEPRAATKNKILGLTQT
jgi:hypothetical protein